MLIGVGVVAVTAILAKIFLFGNKKKTKSPVTLQDPNTKYPLKLVDKEVRKPNPLLLYRTPTQNW